MQISTKIGLNWLHLKRSKARSHVRSLTERRGITTPSFLLMSTITNMDTDMNMSTDMDTSITTSMDMNITMSTGMSITMNMGMDTNITTSTDTSTATTLTAKAELSITATVSFLYINIVI